MITLYSISTSIQLSPMKLLNQDIIAYQHLYWRIVLMSCLSYLVNLSFTTGEFLNLCKIARVIPLFEKVDPVDCSNYRSISLLSIFSKICQKCVSRHLYSFLEKNSLAFKHFSFGSGYSSIYKIVNLVESIKKYTDNDNYLCSVIIDLKKACVM